MFKDHLKQQQVTYLQHQRLAFFIAWQSIKVAIMALIHGLWPSFFVTWASKLHNRIMPEYDKKHEKYKKWNK